MSKNTKTTKAKNPVKKPLTLKQAMRRKEQLEKHITRLHAKLVKTVTPQA